MNQMPLAALLQTILTGAAIQIIESQADGK
jgi:hypothetical protein